MARAFGWLALAGAVYWGAGCKMCDGNNDYTGPVYQDGYQTGNFYARRGSILGPGGVPASSPQANMPDPQPTVAPLPAETPNTTPPNP